MRFLNKLKNIRFKRLFKKRNLALTIIIFLLLAWGLMRGCTQDEMERKRFYLIGRDSTWYPFNLRGKERNLIAFTNDLMAAIAKETKLHFEWIETSPSTLLEGLNIENYDAIISTLQPNFVNRTHYLFSNLFFELGLVLIVQQNSLVTSLKDLQGKTIAISHNSYPIFNSIREGGVQTYNIQLITYDSINQALDLLKTGRLDGIVAHTLTAYALTKSFNRESFKIATPPLTDEGLRLITLQNETSEALIKDFNQALKTIKENGEYAQLIAKWDLIDPSVQFIK